MIAYCHVREMDEGHLLETDLEELIELKIGILAFVLGIDVKVS